MTNEQLRSLMLAMLRGNISTDDVGFPNKRYLDKSLEIEARSELVQLLRSSEPITSQLRNALADLIEVVPSPDNRSERTIVFKFRSKGARRDEYRDSEISNHVLERVQRGDKLEAAIASAMEAYKLSRAEVFRIWKRHSPIYRGMEWLT